MRSIDQVFLRFKAICIGGIGVLLALPTAATEVYRWVDEEGVVHFSDTKSEAAGQVDTLVVTESNPPGYDPLNDPYNILNQAERTAEMMAKVEKEREARNREREESRSDYLYADSRNRRPFLYANRWPYYAPPLYPPQRPLPGSSYRRQWSALQQNDLTGPRPASINSGEHAARVERSQALPLTPPPPRPRSPGPRRP